MVVEVKGDEGEGGAVKGKARIVLSQFYSLIAASSIHAFDIHQALQPLQPRMLLRPRLLRLALALRTIVGRVP